MASFSTDRRVSIQLLGSVSAVIDGMPVTKIGYANVKSLLGYLAASPNKRLSRSRIAALLWPEMEPARAQLNLRQALFRLRQVFEPFVAVDTLFASDRASISLIAGNGVEIDVQTIQRLSLPPNGKGHSYRLDELAEWQKAANLYQGPFLDNLSASVSPEFEAWQARQQDEIHKRMLLLLHHLIVGYRQLGHTDMAIAAAGRFIELEPWDESAYMTLMHLLAGVGRTTQALRLYESCERQLHQELGIRPSARLATFADQLAQRREVSPFFESTPMFAPA